MSNQKDMTMQSRMDLRFFEGAGKRGKDASWGRGLYIGTRLFSFFPGPSTGALNCFRDRPEYKK